MAKGEAQGALWDRQQADADYGEQHTGRWQIYLGIAISAWGTNATSIKVILPLTVLRRFDCILPTKDKVLAEYSKLKGNRKIRQRSPAGITGVVLQPLKADV